MRICSNDGCAKRVKARGLCGTHHMAWLRANPAGPRLLPHQRERQSHEEYVEKALQRIQANHRVDDAGCWIWTKGLDQQGYGRGSFRETSLAHRATYLLLVGPIPDGLPLDHLCRVRSCINPAHLEPVTHAENQMRSPIAVAAVNARRTVCHKGHPFTPENTVRHRNHRRRCKICSDARHKRYREALKQRRRAQADALFGESA